MRQKKNIYRDYLILLNSEKALGYTDEEIDEKIKDNNECKAIDKLITDELYSTEEYDGQLVSTERAFRVFCDIVVSRDYKTGDKIWNNFVRMQFNLVEKHKLACYMAARGHGKSFFLALYIAFKQYLLQYFDVGYCTNIPKQKRRFLKSFRAIIDSNEMLAEKKDNKRVERREAPWGNDEVEYNYGVIEGTTIGTTPRGAHYNLAIADDVLREDKKYTDEFIVNYILGVYKQTILRKKGRYIVVGTPWHEEDLFHQLMNQKLDKNSRATGKIVDEGYSFTGFYCKTFPGILDDANKLVLVPEIWKYDELMKEKSRIGEIRFNREILCKCISFKNSLVGSALFRSCMDEKEKMLQVGQQGKKYLIFVDPATSDAPTADFCAMSVWEDNFKEGKFILRNLFHDKGVPITDPTGGSNDLTNVAIKLHKDFNNATLIIEKNNAGVGLIQAIRARGVEVVEHITHVQSANREGKVNDIFDYIEQGLKKAVVVFPASPFDIYTLDKLEKVKEEHLNFGVKRSAKGEIYEALAGHDDIFTTCYCAFKYRNNNVDTVPYAFTSTGQNEEYNPNIPRDIMFL